MRLFLALFIHSPPANHRLGFESFATSVPGTPSITLHLTLHLRWRSQQCHEYGRVSKPDSPNTDFLMAPLTFEDRRPIKRSSSTAGFDDHGATKRKREDSAYQKITGVVNGAQSRERVALDSAVAETLLTRSISLALDVVGFEASEPLALESFRMGVEECMRLPICRYYRCVC